MSSVTPQRQAEQQRRAQRLRAFNDLLDPSNLLPGHTVADLYSIRQLCLQGGGIPEGSTTQKWIRSQAWMVLLGYLPPEKSEWTQTLDRRRADYYQFVSALASSPDGSDELPGASPERDALLDQIYRDLSRSRRNAFAFYRAEIEPSWTCPLTEPPKGAGESGPSTTSRHYVQRLGGRHALLRRLEKINPDYAETVREEEAATRAGEGSAFSANTDARIPRLSTPVPDPTAGSRSPPIFLQPPSPQEGGREEGSRGASPFSAAASDDASFASADEGDSDNQGDAEEARSASQPSTANPEASTPPPRFVDRRWHSLLRILYVHALLNPSTGYVQGMGEIVWVLFYVLGNASVPASDEAGASASDTEQTYTYIAGPHDVAGAHAEADAFHLFQALAGELRDVYDFEGIDHGAAGLHIRNSRAGELSASSPSVRRSTSKRTGMAGALRRLSLRLKWVDEDLWSAMHRNSLDPRQPYFSLRWLACCLSTELSLPSIVQVWDCILAEADDVRPQADSTQLVASSAKVELLIDVCCALLVSLRGRLLDALEIPGAGDPFERGMAVLQDFSELEVSPVIDLACLYRQRRLAAPLTGDAPPEDDDEDVGDDSTASLSALRDRARQALNAWGSSTNAGPGSRWLQSLKTRPAGKEDDGASATPASSLPPTPSTPRASSSPMTTGARLQRYAVAFQSSDAAASLSKASTNLAAKAMASWAAGSPLLTRSRETSPEAPETPGGTFRMSSFAEMSPSFFRKASSGTRSASMSSSNGFPSATGATPVHPALRWNKDMPPLPLPNVEDDDPGREDYGWAGVGGGARRPGSIAGMSPASSRTGSVSGSPAVGSGSFDSSPRSSTLPRSIARGLAGRKPLLMASAARPPREGSHAEALAAEPSRKISSGPLGISAVGSVQGSGYTRPSLASRSGSSRRDSGSVSGASIGWRSRQASEADVETSSAFESDADRKWTSQAAPMASPVTADMEEAAAASTPVPALASLLPSLQAAAAAGLTDPDASARLNGTSSGPSNADTAIAPLGYMGSGHGTGHGTVPAAAFAKVRAVSGGSDVVATTIDSQHSDGSPASLRSSGSAVDGFVAPDSVAKTLANRPPFGQVESSSDVPLVPTLGRTTRSRRRAQRAGSESLRSSLHEPGPDERQEDAEGSEELVASPEPTVPASAPKYTLSDDPVSLSDRAVPMADQGQSEDNSTRLGDRDAASMYDDFQAPAPTATASPLRRSTGGSHSTSTTSGGGGISRSKLTYSGKKTRTASTSSSSFGGTPSSASIQEQSGINTARAPSTARTSISSIVSADRRISTASRRSYNGVAGTRLSIDDHAAGTYGASGGEVDGTYMLSPPLAAMPDPSVVRPPSPGQAAGLSLSSSDLMQQLQLEGEGQEDVLMHHRSASKRQSSGTSWPQGETDSDFAAVTDNGAAPAIFGYAPRDSRGFRRVARDVPDDGDLDHEHDVGEDGAVLPRREGI